MIATNLQVSIQMPFLADLNMRESRWNGRFLFSLWRSKDVTLERGT